MIGNASPRVYVHNLPYSYGEDELSSLFTAHGEVINATIMRTQTKKSKGCGLVEFSSEQEATSAIEAMNDSEVDGRKILVREDRDPKSNPKSNPNAPRNKEQREPRSEPRSSAVISPANEAVGRQVFVNNLDKSITWQELKDAFSPAGKVIRADIIGDDAGLSKGQGLILFETKAAAQRAINDYHEGELKEKIISVKMDTKVGQYGRLPSGSAASASSGSNTTNTNSNTNGGAVVTSKRVYVHNLPYNVTWQDLKDLFRPCGNIAFADIMRGPDKKSKGCGIVEFSTESEAAHAIETMNEHDINGRQILVREDREASRRAPRKQEA